jgi:serine/threonine protein kinase
MAKVILGSGNPGPVNDGERRVIHWLKKHLPDNFELYPNLTVVVDGGRSQVECDIIVLGPDCMWVVEVKDLAGRVIVGEHEFMVDGQPRSHPLLDTRLKAQKIKSRLSRDPELAAVWIQHVVVLAREPRSLSIADAVSDLVVNPMRASDILENPELVGLKRDRLPEVRRARIRERLAIDASARAPRARFGPWRTERLLSAGGGRRWWLARHEVFDSYGVLEVTSIDPIKPKPEQAAIKEQALRAAKVGNTIGPSPRILAPTNAFTDDDGSVVVVHPRSPLPTLETDLDDILTRTDEVRQTIVADVAEAVALCHARGIAHRLIGPSAIHVDRDGESALAGFGYALLDGQAATVEPSDWANLGDFWAAPEHAAGDVGPEADLFALGSLIEALWPDGAPEEFAAAASALMADDPAERMPTAAELATIGRAEEIAPETIEIELAPGALFDDRYLLADPISSGAATTIWKATDTFVDQTVALKVYDAGSSGDRLTLEYESLHENTHDGIVRIRQVDRVGEHWYLVSEFLDGPDLRAAMLEPDGVRSEEAATIVLRLLAALRSVHPDMDEIARLLDDADTEGNLARLAELREAGLAHRDITPENIILTVERGPVLVDFGLASRSGGATIGATQSYLPPDAAPDNADPDVDLFAVGVILHELLTGRHPYSDRDPVAGELDIDETIGTSLVSVVARACAPKRADRFRSAGEFIDAIATLALPEAALPSPKVGVVDILRAIDAALAAGRPADAMEICPPEWEGVRERIELHLRAMKDAAVTPSLLEINGWNLTSNGTAPFATAIDTGGEERGPGMANVYLIHGPAGEAIEIHDNVTSDARWVVVSDTFQTPLPLKRLGQGLRMGSTIDGDRIMIELRQARINNDKLWSNVYKATPAELDAGAGCDVGELLYAWGGVGYGTREEVVGDDSRRRNDMCVTGSPNVEHLPAVAYLLTRVLPLAAGERTK